MKKLLVIILFAPFILFAQSRKQRKVLEEQQKADKEMISRLRSHVDFFSNQQMAGSLDRISFYISEQFKSAGLQPKASSEFIQKFKINEGRKIDSTTYFKINDRSLALYKDYYPLNYSATGKVTGMPAMALREKGVPWFTDLKTLLEDKNKKGKQRIEDIIQGEVKKVAAKGATALFIYNSGIAYDSLIFTGKANQILNIPVVYVTNQAADKFFSDKSDILDIELNIAFADSFRTGYNVIGYLDNHAPHNVIIISHLPGSQADSFSLISSGDYKGGLGLCNQGLLIELAKMLSTSKSKTCNYIFAASQSELKGVNSFYAEPNPLFSGANYVVNLNNIDLTNLNKKFVVSDYSSAPGLIEAISTLNSGKAEFFLDSIIKKNFINEFFFNRSIPVISFSADSSSTYKENAQLDFDAELSLLKYISNLIASASLKGKHNFVEPVISQNQLRN